MPVSIRLRATGSGDDLEGLAVALAEDDVALLESILGADEYGFAALDGLDGTERRDDGDRARRPCCSPLAETET